MAGIPSKRLSGGPPSVADLYKQAANFDYDPAIPLRFWLRTASTMQKEAQVHIREGNDEQTYRVLLRNAILVCQKLPEHPEARDPKYKAALSEAQKAANIGLERVEELKPRIKKRHVEYAEYARKRSQLEALRQKRGSRTEGDILDAEMNVLSIQSKTNRASVPYGTKKVLDPARDQGLAAKLAYREARRRDAARRSVRQAGVSEEEEQERRTGGLWGDWEKDLVREDDDDLSLSRRIQEVGKRKDGDYAKSEQGRRVSVGGTRSLPSTAYQYPTVPQKSSQGNWENTTAPVPPSKRPLSRDDIHSYDRSPQLPPKPPRRAEVGTDTPPPVPAKLRDSALSEPLARSETPPVAELNSSDYNFPPHAYLESGEPLRTMFLPPNLRTRFLAIAEENTRRNIETCGILCGTLISNALFVQKLVIPEQEGTSDTCETMNEGAVFDYMDKEDLMTLGWIHTHPSQTCFMSSRDLHTHSGYQVMLPESIAIVCAPSKDPSWGVFRLTDPPGLKTVLNCTQSGLFHPHGEMNTYTDALRPGHVCEIAALDFDVVDLRPGKGCP